MAHVRLLYSNRSVFALAGLTLLLACPRLPAQQFVLFDVTFTFTKEDADNSRPSKSHYYVRGKMLNADRPKDWVKPVDYRNGTVHIRAEVFEKPAGGAPTTWTLCYIPNKGRKNGYGCTGTEVYREKGVYERDVKMTSFWQNDNLVWEQGIKEMHLVMKDDSGGSGHAHKRTDPEKFFPTKMRITMIQVAKGSTYDPKLVPNLPAKDDPKPGKAAATSGRTETSQDAQELDGPIGHDPCKESSLEGAGLERIPLGESTTHSGRKSSVNELRLDRVEKRVLRSSRGGKAYRGSGFNLTRMPWTGWPASSTSRTQPFQDSFSFTTLNTSTLVPCCSATGPIVSKTNTPRGNRY